MPTGCRCELELPTCRHAQDLSGEPGTLPFYPDLGLMQIACQIDIAHMINITTRSVRLEVAHLIVITTRSVSEGQTFAVFLPCTRHPLLTLRGMRMAVPR